MTRVIAAAALACALSAPVWPQDATPQAPQTDLSALANQLQQLNQADRQALQAQLGTAQNSSALNALLQAAQNSAPQTVVQLPNGQQAQYDTATLGRLLREAAQAGEDHMSLRLSRPEYEYRIPTVGNPVLPTLPGQPTITLPGTGAPLRPNPPCELPAYCRHLPADSPLCKCPDSGNTGSNQ